MMASLEDKLCVLLDEGVLYFRPQNLVADCEESKDGTIVVKRDSMQVLKGYPEGHKVIGMVGYPQGREKSEMATFTENLELKEFGLQIYWEDDRQIEIRHGSQNWRWPQQHRMVKIQYLHRRDDEETRGYASRDLWKDKKMMFLDAGGNSHRLDGFWWHHQHKKVHNKCIDIQTDGNRYYTKHLLGKMDI